MVEMPATAGQRPGAFSAGGAVQGAEHHVRAFAMMNSIMAVAVTARTLKANRRDEGSAAPSAALQNS